MGILKANINKSMNHNKKFFLKKKKETIKEDVKNQEVIYVENCEGTTFYFSGKFNNLTLNRCKDVTVVVDTLIASLELLDAKDVRIKVNENVNLLSIERSEKVSIEIPNPDNLDIVHTGSNGINILVPKGDGEYIEHPLPTSTTSRFNSDNKLMNTVVENH